MTKQSNAPKNHKLGLSEASLRAVLDHDAERGALVADRGNKISRRHYADKLGCTKANLTRFISVFSEYEKLYAVVAGLNKFFDEMKSWLTEAYEKRELEFRSGKVIRLQFQKEFEISYGGKLKKYPEIEAMFEEIEERARQESYTELGKNCAGPATNDVAKPTMEERLKILLDDDAKNKCLVSDVGNQISRRHYSNILGCAPSNLTRFGKIFADFEGKYELLAGPADVNASKMAEKLKLLLNADAENECLVADRGGKISRRHYAEILGCSRSNLTRFIAVFAKYEKKYRIATGPLRYLPEMRAWLTAAYDKRELGLRDGKVDRVAFSEHFELRGGVFLTRYSEIRDLFDEFDERANQEGYLQLDREQDFQRVKEALAGEVPLNKDRLQISRPALAEAIQVPLERLKEKSFVDLIITREAEIKAAAKASKIDPFLHGRVFPFSGLKPRWPTDFLEKVGIIFAQTAGGLAAESSKQPYLSLLGALEWIGESNDPPCIAAVAEAQEQGRIRSLDDWEEALFAYRARLMAGIAEGTDTDTGIDGKISTLRPMLDALASGGIVPRTSVPLPGVKYASRNVEHRKSVAEASLVDPDKDLAPYIAFARNHYFDACKSIGTDLGEADDFIMGLALELRETPDLPDDAASAVRKVLERRLDALRNRAAEIVEAAIEAYERGNELLSEADIDGAAFERDYLGTALNQYQRRQLVRNLFPNPQDSNPAEARKAVANLVALIDQRHAGIPPASSMKLHQESPYGAFFAKRYLSYGGVELIERMLIPDANTVGAILTLYLCESGANVSVGRTLDRDCIEESDLENYARITGCKARAEGKPIYVDLPATSPAVKAINWLLSAGRRLEAAAKDDRDRLLVMRVGSRIQLMTSHWFTAWFKKFAANISSLKDIKLLPSMIRPSVLLLAALSNDGRLAVGMAIGQHGSAVTKGYQNKWPTRLLYDENIQRFQTAFESLILSSVEDAAAHLGITVEQFEDRLGNLRATGLGTFCKDHRGRPGEQSESCSKINCWDDCPHLLIVAELEAIAALQLWQAALLLAQPDWERDRPDRWEAVWLPWLCLTIVVEEKMVRGHLLKFWNDARRYADQLSAQPSFIPPKPY